MKSIENKTVVYGVAVERGMSNPRLFSTKEDAVRFRDMKGKMPKFHPVKAYEDDDPGGEPVAVWKLERRRLVCLGSTYVRFCMGEVVA